MSGLKEIAPVKSKSNVCIVEAIRKVLELSILKQIISLEIRYTIRGASEPKRIVINDTIHLRS